MIKSIHIENLRGIREGAIEDLAQVNILVDRNNSGKSTVLDAVYLARETVADKDQLGRICLELIHTRRAPNRQEDQRELWYRLDPTSPIEILVSFGPGQLMAAEVAPVLPPFESWSWPRRSQVGKDGKPLQEIRWDGTPPGSYLSSSLLLDVPLVRTPSVLEETLWKQMAPRLLHLRIVEALRDIYGIGMLLPVI